MTEAERVGDLAKRPARQLEAAYGMVEVRAGHLHGAFGVYQPRFRGPRLLKQSAIERHAVYCT
jgi:hypothetical protein